MQAALEAQNALKEAREEEETRQVSLAVRLRDERANPLSPYLLNSYLPRYTRVRDERANPLSPNGNPCTTPCYCTAQAG